MTGPLDGVRVLDLTRLLPGGYATLLLADLGADVVKVEEPRRGDYIRWTPPTVGEHSAAHIALNRNKRSVALDLRVPGGRDAFLRLVERCDVVIESFRPGVMDRLGVGYDTLVGRKRDLIYCAVTGYGQDGPRAADAGHDINYMGYAGALSLVGEPGRAPVVPGLQIGDLGGGAMAAAIAVLAALHKRAASGEGSFCDVAMADGVFSWLSIHAGAFVATGEVPTRGLMPLSGLYPCYRVYPAADGWITVGALEPQFWTALCDALDRPDLKDDGYATGMRRDEVIAELAEVFATATRAEWMRRLAGLDVCVAPVNDLAEAFADPQLVHRRMIVDADIAGTGSWRHVGNPVRMDHDDDDLVRRPPPRLGEHTDEVLGEIGFEPDAIDALRADGAVG